MADTFSSILADADDAVLDALGETVTITGKGTVVGVFDEETVYELDMQGTRPVFEYQQADITIVAGDELVRGSDTYDVRQIEPDGTGMNKLILSET